MGIVANIDYSDARCPQSIYLYRLTHEALAGGYTPEFVLAALLSRVQTYFIFKRFGEIDVAKAHPKLTHDRLASLPIPRLDGGQAARRTVEAITADVRALLQGDAQLGGQEDLRIELSLRTLWHLDPSDGAYINGQFADIPPGQAVADLFPNGVPKRSKRIVDV